MRCRFSSLLALLLLAATCHAATYYIDFAAGSDANNGTTKTTPWKRAPGMTGFAATYTHAAGDQFIFKGGVTWDNTIAPWTISNSGAAGNPDYYGVDKTWYSGGTWSQPILDGGSLASGQVTPYWLVSGAGYITIDNLAIVNLGQAGIHQDVQSLRLYSTHDILVENMTFAPYVRISMGVFNSSGALRSNIEIKNNDFSHACWGIGGQPATNSPMSNVLIHDNTFHDFHTQLTNSAGCHGDAIYFYTTNGLDSTAYMDNFRVYNNVFYGDFSGWTGGPSNASTMSSMIWTGAQYQGAAYVYNNHMSTSAGSVAYPFGVSGAASGASPSPTGTVSIYNNSAQITTTVSGYLELDGVSNVTVENNILVGGLKGITNTYSPIGSLTSNYNDFYGWSNATFASFLGAVNYTYAQFKAAGYEANGLNADPLFTSATDSGTGANLHLQSGSTARSAGVNLSSVFTTDAVGTTRPSSGVWDIGAYQFVGSPTSSQQWSMGYYNYADMPISSINWSGITHIIQSIGVVQSACTIELASHYINTQGANVVAAAHAAGAKALITFDQSYWTGDTTSLHNCATNSMSTLVTNMVNVMTTYGYDGIDIDWEPFSATDAALRASLHAALRTAIGSSAILTNTSSVDQYSTWTLARTADLDRVNIMTYDLGGTFEPKSWFNSPLYGDSTSYWSVDLAVIRFRAAGVPAAKLGIGLPFYGYSGTNPQLPRQTWNSPTRTQIQYKDIYPQITQGNYVWDSITYTPYLTLPTSYISYDNEASIAAKINYAKTNNLGGWIIWSIGQDLISGAHPLMQAVATAMATVPTVTTTALSSGTLGSAYSQTLTATGDTPITWSITAGTLPHGLNIYTSTGVISGTPDTVSVSNFTVTATNAAGHSDKALSIIINPQPVSLIIAGNVSLTGKVSFTGRGQ